MSMLRWIGCATLCAAAATALAQDKPPATAVEAFRFGTVKAPVPVLQRTDLVIDAIEWVARDPGSPQRGAVTSVVVQTAHLRVTVRNAGTERWASSGWVDAEVRLGTPDEFDGRRSDATKRVGVRPATGPKTALDAQFDSMRAPYFGRASIPGSLAPGERRVVEFRLASALRARDASAPLLIEVDKFYTARVNLQVSGDDQPKNNGADLTFRVNARGLMIVGPMFKPRETDIAKRGTVEVVAPR